ncbi:hypothetical protein [Luteibacter sahnii]|jgi:hypothetical protein|uniref:hypothetical protein n=1 Tax=Luteibacter sahnii TaxID=3021977 RepID=UPI002A6AA030|nr:hypothetical protein [Luteibacter sp. PPL193]MDY1548633.1 hypothetical protein [Luteibacter sp. PPL193]
MRIRPLLLATALVVMPVAAGAQQAITGLGQSWPNSTDVSSSPNYHVYVFQRGNTRYVQVNDANGNVRGAFARTPYSIIGLPVGADAANLATQDEPLPPATNTSSEKVYEDSGIKVFVSPQPSGAYRVMAVSGDCKGDPQECTTHSP